MLMLKGYEDEIEWQDESNTLNKAGKYDKVTSTYKFHLIWCLCDNNAHKSSSPKKNVSGGKY